MPQPPGWVEQHPGLATGDAILWKTLPLLKVSHRSCSIGSEDPVDPSRVRGSLKQLVLQVPDGIAGIATLQIQAAIGEPIIGGVELAQVIGPTTPSATPSRSRSGTTPLMPYGRPEVAIGLPGSLTNCAPKSCERPFRHVCRRGTAVA
jgi:hypothetical protein